MIAFKCLDIVNGREELLHHGNPSWVIECLLCRHRCSVCSEGGLRLIAVNGHSWFSVWLETPRTQDRVVSDHNGAGGNEQHHSAHGRERSLGTL